MHVVIILNQAPLCHVMKQLIYSSLNVFRFLFKPQVNPERLKWRTPGSEILRGLSNAMNPIIICGDNPRVGVSSLEIFYLHINYTAYL